MTRRSPRRAAAVLAASLLAVAPLAACGGDDDGDDAATSSTVSPESVRVPMSEVLAGLPKIVQHANAAAAAANTGDYTTALAESDALHVIWLSIEGTIKATDQDTYIRSEDAQGLIKDGAEHDNAERIQQGADDQSEAAAEFLAANGG